MCHLLAPATLAALVHVPPLPYVVPLSKTLSVVVLSIFGNVIQNPKSEIRNTESERGPGGETRSLDSESEIRNPKYGIREGPWGETRSLDSESEIRNSKYGIREGPWGGSL